MKEILVVPVKDGPWEYFCKACSQLRLFARGGKPTACTNCGSSEIEVDKPGSERLSKLRFGK